MTKKTQAIVLGVMCLILTIAICIQIKTVNSNGTTTSSNKNLNDLKTQVLKMKEKYEDTYQKLDNVQKELEEARNKVTSNDEELKSLEEKIRKYNVLSGTTEVTGQGVRITVTDATNSINSLIDPIELIVHDTDILEIVNELKNAGAEAIEVNGQRIAINTAISCDGAPFEIKAIGLPERLGTLNRPGGYLNELEEYGIKTTFKEEEKTTIPKYIGITSFKYAKTVK